jgi:hypothetical protein
MTPRKRKPTDVERPIVQNEVLAPPPGETPIYHLVLGDADVEKLAAGCVSKDLMEQAYGMLSWKRELNQRWEDYRCPACRKKGL